MQQDNQKPIRKTRRRLIIAAISVLLLALSSFGTVLVLNQVTSNKKKTDAISAEDLIKKLNDSPDLVSLSSKLYQKQINNSSSISFSLNDKSYSVYVPTNQSTLYFAASQSQPNDDSTVQSDITTFMKKYQLEKSGNTDTSISGLVYTTFVGDRAVCQLEDSSPPANSGMLRSHKVSCADKSAVENEYAAIEKLLSIYKKSHTMAKFSKALRITKTDKNVAYSLIYLTNETTPSTLLFAAVNDKWEYLGDLSAGDQKYSTGQYIITPELKTLINDSKYNGLIVQDIH